MKTLIRTCTRLLAPGVAALMSLSCTPSSQAAGPEIVVWPHQESNQLSIARETTQPFYIMAYNRGEALSGASEVEITVPRNWQVWRGSDAPPSADDTATDETAQGARQLKLPLSLRATKDTVTSKDYSAANAAGNLLMVVRPLPQAAAASLKLRWLQNETVLAEREVALKPLQLQWDAPGSGSGSITAGMWLNDPKFHPETMALVYRGLHRCGIDYVVITREMYRQSAALLRELGIKAFIGQWWNFRAYVPGAPPAAAYSTVKDGSIDRKRWSPTYMAEGGAEFIKQVEAIADAMKQMEGAYALMLDYEPGTAGIEADYGAASRQAFEKSIQRPVRAWPADVLPGGKEEEAWINFRNDQSEAYVRWFQKILRERAPGVKLAVSTSGATLTPDDMNRRLAVTDITQLSRTADSIHPQLYSWTSKLPAQLARFNDKLKLGQTTIAGSKAPVYTTVGTMVGKTALADPEYLRTQILNWWFHGARGFEIWQYFYGVDGRYMAMVNELSHLIAAAGEPPQDALSTTPILTVDSNDKVQILSRQTADGKTAWVGVFNFSSQPVDVPLRPRAGWHLVENEQDSAKIEPWKVHVVKCVRE